MVGSSTAPSLVTSFKVQILLEGAMLLSFQQHDGLQVMSMMWLLLFSGVGSLGGQFQTCVCQLARRSSSRQQVLKKHYNTLLYSQLAPVLHFQLTYFRSFALRPCPCFDNDTMTTKNDIHLAGKRRTIQIQVEVQYQTSNFIDLKE